MRISNINIVLTWLRKVKDYMRKNNSKKIISRAKLEVKRLFYENRIVFDLGVTKEKRNPQIIVSLTTYPARIDKVNRAIKTLLTQSTKPDRVILWLAESQFPNKEADLPKKLLKLCKYGLEIKWCEDLKSYKKLIPTIVKYPNDVVITVDDDLLYDKHMIEKLYNSYLKHPQCISCLRAHLMTFINDGTLRPYNEWIK